jgi:hypothetical protein
MIADVRRVVRVLDCDVQTEEERSRIFDRSDAHYPIPGKDAGGPPRQS